MIAAVCQLYYIIAYYLSWVWFGLGGLLLNLACAPLLLLPHRERFGPAVRRTIRRMFAWWLKWFHASGVLRVDWRGFPADELPNGSVYVANHPTLIDAPILLSRIPEATCIFKPSLLRNPFIGPAAILAGYTAGGGVVDLVRDAADQVSAGRSLLIFPEGTRTTPGQALNPLKPGFALIAARAGAPVRLMTIRSSPRLVARGRAWWKPPQLPAWMEITFHGELSKETELSAADITQLTQDRLASLVGVVPSCPSSCHDRTPTSC
jgi:1-acyl-sn-glycerol-3-phosphate acyltransferase